MEKDWKRVYFKGDDFKSTIASELLEENNIHSVILNRKDFSFTSFGDIEVYVNQKDEEEANKILEQLKLGDS